MSVSKKSAMVAKTIVPPSTQKKLNTSSEPKSIVPAMASNHEGVKILTTADDSIFEQPITPNNNEASRTI